MSCQVGGGFFRLISVLGLGGPGDVMSDWCNPRRVWPFVLGRAVDARSQSGIFWNEPHDHRLVEPDHQTADYTGSMATSPRLANRW